MAGSEDKQDKEENGAKQPEVVLIANLEALLVTGETIRLLPIRHENDVKSDVTKLLEEWASSGFLLRGNIAYPWHQVRYVLVTSVEELAPHEVHQRMLALEGADRAQLQQGFWKTRAARKDEEKDKADEQDGGEKKP
jgi:hypothetical protein